MNKSKAKAISLVVVGVAAISLMLNSAYNSGLIKACSMVMSNVIPPQFGPSCDILNGRLVTSFSAPDGIERTYDVETGRLAE